MKHKFLKSVFLFFFSIAFAVPVLGNEHTSIKTEWSRKSISLNSDSIFSQYAQSGFLSVISDLYYYYDEVLLFLPPEKQKGELKKMEKIANQYKSQELKNEFQFVSAMLLPEDSLSDLSVKIELLDIVASDAVKRKDQVMKLRVLRAEFNLYWKTKQYGKAFQIAFILDKDLQNVTDEEYPEKGMVYYEIGDAYYYFHDYDKAISYLHKAVKPAKYFFDTSAIQAQNRLGAYYAMKERTDSADYYFRKAYFSPGKVKDRTVLDAISLSNMGYSFLLNKEYDKAIEYMESGLGHLIKADKFVEASNVTLRLVDCYMAKNNLRKSKQLIDSAEVYIKNSAEEDDLQRSLYTIKGRYYARTGNSKLSGAYMDSAFAANRTYEQKYNSLKVLRAEQRIFEAEAKAKDEQLRLKEENYNNVVFYLYCLIFGILLVILIVVGTVFYLRRKSKMHPVPELLLAEEATQSDEAHAESRQSEESANTAAIHNGNIEDQHEVSLIEEDLTEEDLNLIKKVEDLIKKDEIYKDLDLTLDLLAKNLKVNRNYLSKAINRVTGKNFNTYINEYRIKEAIRILSDKKSDVISIDAIALEVGFSNRISFYQSFKKMTGLSPSEFRNNKDSEIVINA